MPPCPAEAGSDPALAEPRPCLLSLALSWPLLASLHCLQLPALEETELQGASLLPRC